MLGSSLELFGWNFVRLEAGSFTPKSSESAKLPLRATDLTRAKSQRNLSTAEVAKLKSEVMEAGKPSSSKKMENPDAPESASSGKDRTKAIIPKAKSPTRPRVRLGRGMAAKLACKQLLEALATPATGTSSKTAPKTNKGTSTSSKTAPKTNKGKSTSSKTAPKTNKGKTNAKAKAKAKARIFLSFKQNQTNQGNMPFTSTYCF